MRALVSSSCGNLPQKFRPGTDGLGKESLRQVSRHQPARIYLAARNLSKAHVTVSEIQSQFPSSRECPTIEILIMDFSSLSSVDKAAQKFLIQVDRLDILLCNAALLADRGVTEDGYKLIFGTNHLGHSLLISLLLPRFLSTAKLPGVNEGDTRCVIVGSAGERLAAKNSYLSDSIRSDLGHLSLWARYGQSKVLAEKYPEEESVLEFVSVHPGTVITNMGSALIPNKYIRQALKVVAEAFFGVVPVGIGVQNQLWATTGPSCLDAKAEKDVVISRSGQFYYPVGKVGKGSKRSEDIEMASRLWDWTQKELEPWLER